MGRIVHDAIVVTCFDEKRLVKARKKAVKLLGHLVSKTVKSNMNGYCSFFVAPDGSKEGWDESNKGDENRQKFKDWLKEQKELYCDWVEVRFGCDLECSPYVEDSYYEPDWR